jgi:surface carbohydrate biosynthesis protein
MARRYLYILIEESFRELPSRVLITRAALEAGFDVVLGQQWWFTANFQHLPPGIVLLKGNNAIQVNTMAAAKAAGHKVASIEEEAFGLRDADIVLRLFDPGAESLCDLFLMQGTHHANLLKERFASVREKIIVVGNPRVEVLRIARESATTRKTAHFAKEHGEFVLINTNFGAINPFEYDAYAFYLRCLKVGILRPDDKIQMELFHSRCEWERSNLRQMVRFIRGMSVRHPEIPMVLRPHPAENVDIWHSEMRAYPSVHVVVDDDHVPWILASRCMVHSGSTTGIEAFLLGRPAIDLCADVFSFRDRFIAPLVNTVVHDGADAVDEVERVFTAKRSREEEVRRSEELQPYMDTDFPPSPRRIADALLTIARVTNRDEIPDNLAAPQPSSRQRAKAFVSMDTVNGMFWESSREKPNLKIGIREIGPAVWHVTNGDLGS